MVPIIVIRPIGYFLVYVVIAPVVVRGVLECVVSIERQTGGEPLFYDCLQRVVVVIGIVAEVIDVLLPAIRKIKRPTRVSRYCAVWTLRWIRHCKRSRQKVTSWEIVHNGRVIRSVRGPATGKGVRAFVTDIGERCGDRRSNLALH